MTGNRRRRSQIAQAQKLAREWLKIFK